MEKPSVSVIMPFLDPPPNLFKAAIDSVRQQSMSRWELILVDDGSGRLALDVAHAAASQDGRIRVVASASPRPAGTSMARNVGFSAATARVIALLDADDVYETRRLERHLETLETQPNAAMVVGNTRFWRSWSAGEGSRDDEVDTVPGLGLEPGLVHPPRLLTDLLVNRCRVPCTCSFTIRAQVFADVGGFEPSFREMFEDHVLLAKIAAGYPILYLAETLDRYRIRRGSVTDGTRRSMNPDLRRQFLDWVAEHGLAYASPAARPRVQRALQRAYWQLRHPRLASIPRRFRKLMTRLGIR